MNVAFYNTCIRTDWRGILHVYVDIDLQHDMSNKPCVCRHITA